MFTADNTPSFDTRVNADANSINNRNNLPRKKLSFLTEGALQKAIIASINFAVIVTDENGTIQIFSASAERMLGYQADEVVDRLTPSDMHDPQEEVIRAQALSLEFGASIAPGFEAMTYKASRRIEDSYELTYICKSGRRFPAVVSITALRDDNDEIIGYLKIVVDNSVRKQIELDLHSALAAAEKANRAKSEFLSSMSHELRTPLSAILGFAQLLESGSPPPTSTQLSNIDQILQAGWYLLELINEILDLALIESGKLSVSLEATSLAEVVHECYGMIEPEALKRGVTLNFPPFDNTYFVRADRTRLKQVLINLLANAIKYNRMYGSVTVHYLVDGSGSIRVCVGDSGEGLTLEKQEQLFQPFNRLGQESSTEEGTGIGLVMCKRLVDLMEGKIGVESTVGAGSVFWFELPLTEKPQEIDPSLQPIALAKPQLDNSTSQYTLLYIEDNPANLALVRQLVMRRSDINFLSAINGNSGIELARKTLPDVILMDINLPGISGMTVLKMLREDLVTRHIPVIAISANAMPADIKKGLEAGFVKYLTKPIKVNEFMRTIDAVLTSSDVSSSSIRSFKNINNAGKGN